MENLINAWRELDLQSLPLVLPEDRLAFHADEGMLVTRTYQEYLECDLSHLDDSRLHVGLLPQPFHGSVLSASVYLLMLNPGMGPADYFSEERSSEYRAALVDNLHQAPQRQYPLLFLDPQFAWHPGARYFRGKLNWLVHEISNDRRIEYLEALRFVSQDVCCLELVPYHSTKFRMRDALLESLHSVKLMRKFVAELIESRPDALFIATRAITRWHLPRQSNIVAYDAQQSRSAHLTPESPGGKALLKHYDLPIE